MSNFTFGAPAFSATPTTTTAAPAFGTAALNFGAPATATQAPTFGASAGTQAPTFGASATTQLPTFGASAATQLPTFGAPVATQAPTFGAPAATQVPTFGAAVAAQAPTFGAPAATQASTFGTPIAAQAPTFGASAATQAPAFGTAAPTQIPTFAAPAATQIPAFGATTSTQAPTFGAATATTIPTFGATAITPAMTLPSLGGGSFSFGTPSVAAATTTTTVPTFNFGNPPAATTAVSTAPTMASAPNLNFNSGQGGISTSMPTTTLPTLSGIGGGSFSFGKPATTTTAPASFSFGNTATQSTAFNLGKPMNITAPTTSATSSTTTTTPFVGLGGIDVSATQPKPDDNKPSNVKVKETLVPDEIAKTVDALKTHIKTQKQLSSDIGRTSTTKLTNVSSEIGKMQWLLQEIANSVEANYNQIKILRKETSKNIQSLEMAQRTQDTPAGLQYENTAPFQYFQELVAKYERDLIYIRQQIALTERHMQSITSPQAVSPEDLRRGFQEINESFISLAGRVQEVHQKVELQKEQFLNLRKYRLRDNNNVFAKLEQSTAKTTYSSNIAAGPSPFAHFSAMDSFGHSFATNSAAAAAANKM